ncbi:hypothetical protein AVEN_27494-1 [Araneus ventricosus]|uniref:Uncharacterized protein n=1 Tax=Araneus ventricosus TaxID=182803 RepID=A0A4Y2VFX8_ARAVE|nr:hypothetical protein AVEN_27494-1 [Araneus ventricosus]
MVTSKLSLTCRKLAASLPSCHDKFVASLHSCHDKFVASLLQTKIAIWEATVKSDELPRSIPHNKRVRKEITDCRKDKSHGSYCIVGGAKRSIVKVLVGGLGWTVT